MNQHFQELYKASWKRLILLGADTILNRWLLESIPLVCLWFMCFAQTTSVAIPIGTGISVLFRQAEYINRPG